MPAPSLILFYIAATVTLGGGLGVVMGRNIVYSAFALLASLLGVAGIFLIAYAQFLALVQVLIYGGAVIIVILFALMLTRVDEFQHLTEHRQWPVAALISGAVFVLIVAGVLGTAVRTTERQGVSFEAVGTDLFVRWAIPFEIASLVLLVALIGAVVLVRNTGGRD
jgi:NADH-quinone oxidoreductase subunit J